MLNLETKWQQIRIGTADGHCLLACLCNSRCAKWSTLLLALALGGPQSPSAPRSVPTMVLAAGTLRLFSLRSKTSAVLTSTVLLHKYQRHERQISLIELLDKRCSSLPLPYIVQRPCHLNHAILPCSWQRACVCKL